MFSKKRGVRDDDGQYRNQYELRLPEVYFHLLDEGEKKICYIYAIKEDINLSCDEKYLKKIEEAEKFYLSLIDAKKHLSNEDVNYRYVLALKFFVELLRENGIYDIKVPLLQIFNYDYCISEGNYYEIIMKRIAKKGDKGSEDYKYYEALYEKYANNKDLISKNKTEGLIGTFMTLEEKFGDIEILSEPFIQDENLIVKVLEPKKNKGSR